LNQFFDVFSVFVANVDASEPSKQHNGQRKSYKETSTQNDAFLAL